MKIFITTTFLITSFTVFWLSKGDFTSIINLSEHPVHFKKPTEVQQHTEEGDNKEKRENYFNLLHGNHPHWKEINLEIHRAKSKSRQENLAKTYNNYANNHLIGEWRERGSSNQAGNLKITDFDQQSNTIYAISDGGILWKSDLSGNNWESLNDGYVLDTRVLKSIRKPDGSIRLLASVGHGLYFSDDEGTTWTLCNGFLTNSSNGSAIDLVQLNDNDSTIIYLYSQTNAFGNGNNKIAISTDHGDSFTPIQTLNTNNSRVASMCSPYNSSIAYIINRENESYIFKNGTLTQAQTNLNYSGTDFYQIEAVITPSDTTIYVLTDKENLYKSTDETASFTSVGTLPVASWDCGIGVSSTDPNHLYFGEVELYESNNGGTSFNLVSNWYDYYGDVPNKIHADIMNIQTFEKSDGTEFTLIPNHGGLNISYDFLTTTPNIALSDLNIGQFYDVATSPINSSIIFGGTQDQGFQRTAAGLGANIIGFDQVISGDYGQQQFTNNGQSIWTQYPGADFSFYQNAATDNSAQFWHNIDGNDMPNYDWIVPTGSAPNPSDNYILVGGGNVTGGDGSYLIKLWDDFGGPQFSQFSFNFKQASGSTISAIETTPLDENKWYVATANGFIYHSENAGQNWTQSSPFGGPSGNWIYGADVYASRLTPGLVFFGGSGYSNPPVYVSTDGGENFTAMNNGLPPTVVHEMCMDPNENFLFAATDAGPYVYSMAQEEWFDISGNDAPIQEYMTCEYVESENIVRFATWGRGIWDFQIIDASSVEEEISEESKINIYPNPAPNGQFKISSNDNYNCVVYNLAGSKVVDINVIKGGNNMNLSFLTKGHYFLIFTKDQKIIERKKITLH